MARKSSDVPAFGAQGGIRRGDKPVVELRVFEVVGADGEIEKVTKEELRVIENENKERRIAERRQQRRDIMEAGWDAEMDNRRIQYAGKLPDKAGEKVKLMCGCDRKATFEANSHQLSKLPRDQICCTQCHIMSKPDKLRKKVEARGGKLLSPYADAHSKVKIECRNGHVFYATPSNVNRKDGGSWCRHCSSAKSGEGRLREILAERGCELVDYRSAGVTKKSVMDAYGDVRDIAYSSLLSSPPTFGTLRGERTVRMFFDEENLKCFGLIDEIPPNLPQALVDIIACGEEDEIGVGANMKECHQILADAIKTYEGESDFKCVNVLHNAEWVSPGVYTWGKFPAFDGTLASTADAVPS